MTSITTPHKYVQLNESHVPIIAGTTMKVVELVMAQIAYGWSHEEPTPRRAKHSDMKF